MSSNSSFSLRVRELAYKVVSKITMWVCGLFVALGAGTMVSSCSFKTGPSLTAFIVGFLLFVIGGGLFIITNRQEERANVFGRRRAIVERAGEHTFGQLSEADSGQAGSLSAHEASSVIEEGVVFDVEDELSSKASSKA